VVYGGDCLLLVQGLVDIRSGFGLGFCGLTLTGFSRALGRGTGSFYERDVFFAWFHWGIACLRVRVVLVGPL
jgi:hypothetical protein